MSGWNEADLTRVGRAEELELASRRDDGTHAALDAAYHEKYDRYGARVVGSVVGPDAATVTLRLDPTARASATTHKHDTKGA